MRIETPGSLAFRAIALPDDKEEIEPAFEHIPASELPEVEQDGCTIRVIMGQCLGSKSPVPTYSETLYLDVVMQAGAVLDLPDEWAEFAIYVVEGSVNIDGNLFESGAMAVAGGGSSLMMSAAAGSRVMVIGGDSVGVRHIYWNFVHSSEARIEQAREDWREGRFEMVPGDDEFIPLPD